MEEIAKRDGVLEAGAAEYERLQKNANMMCYVCGKTDGQLFRCAGCQSIMYCCAEHQRADWKRHKPECLRERAIRRQIEERRDEVKRPPPPPPRPPAGAAPSAASLAVCFRTAVRFCT